MRFDPTDLRLFLHVVEAESIARSRAGRPGASLRQRAHPQPGSGGRRGPARAPSSWRAPDPGRAGGRASRPRRPGSARADAGRARPICARAARARARAGEHRCGGRVPARSFRALPGGPSGDRRRPRGAPEPRDRRRGRGRARRRRHRPDTVDLGSLERLPFRTDRLVLVVPGGHVLAGRPRSRSGIRSTSRSSASATTARSRPTSRGMPPWPAGR